MQNTWVKNFWERPLWRRLWVAAVLTVVAAALGMAVIWWATSILGPGADSDGLSYLVLARSVYAGEGYGYPAPEGGVKPMTHFPPGYPLAIAAAMRLTGTQAATAAVLVNALALVLLVALGALEAYRATHHAVPAAAAAVWLAVSFALQKIFTSVFSEGPFMALVLLTGIALWAWEGRPTLRRAVLLGLVAALTVYVRWVGMVVLGWAGLMLLWWGWQKLPRKALWQQAAAFGAAAGLPVLLLLGVNEWRAGSGTNRHILWHPPGIAKWEQAAQTLVLWLTPGDDWLRHYTPWALPAVVWLRVHPFVFAMGVLLVTGAAVCFAWRRSAGSLSEESPLRSLLRRWLSFAAVYFAGLVAAITIVDALTPMDWRLLVPLFPPLSLVFFVSLWELTRNRPWRQWFFAVFWGMVLLLMVRQARWTFFPAHRYGQVLRSAIWQQADLWPEIRALPPNVWLRTNEMEVTMYYTRRPAHLLSVPISEGGEIRLYDPVTDKVRPLPYADLDAWAEALAEGWRGRCVAVVYVGLKHREAEAPAVAALQRAFRVHFAGESGWIFLPPDSQACVAGQPR